MLGNLGFCPCDTPSDFKKLLNLSCLPCKMEIISLLEGLLQQECEWVGTDLSTPRAPSKCPLSVPGQTLPCRLGGTVLAAHSCLLVTISYPLAPHPDGKSQRSRACLPGAFHLLGFWPHKGCPSTSHKRALLIEGTYRRAVE